MLNYTPHLFNLFIFIMMWTLFEESVNSCDSSNIKRHFYIWLNNFVITLLHEGAAASFFFRTTNMHNIKASTQIQREAGLTFLAQLYCSQWIL